MPNVWVTGADGAIGRACCDILSHHTIYQSKVDVTWAGLIHNEIEQWLPEEMEYLVYCAGYNHLNWSKDIDPNEMMRAFDVNVIGLVRCLQAAPSLSRIVVIGSDAARRPMRTSIAYNASKAALEAAMRVIARERAVEGFQINVVAPGLVSSSRMTDYVVVRTYELRPELDLKEYMLAGIPMRRPAVPRDVARVVKWLIDDAPNYVNGSVIDVNGAR